MSTGNSRPKSPNAANLSMADDEANSLVAQLHSLYSEREKLFAELGVSDTDSILRMIGSLTAQLEALYRERDNK